MKHQLKHNCAFLHRGRLCSHKTTGAQHMKKKVRTCAYDDCNKCGLYNEFVEANHNYINSIKAHHEASYVVPGGIVVPTKPKRCTICNKLLRIQNKSGLCSFHLVRQGSQKRRSKIDSATNQLKYAPTLGGGNAENDDSSLETRYVSKKADTHNKMEPQQ